MKRRALSSAPSNYLKRSAQAALLIYTAYALAACGGGGGGTSTPVSPPTSVLLLTAGDQWDYTLTSAKDSEFGSCTGTLTRTISANTFNNASALEDLDSFVLQFKTGAPVTVNGHTELDPTTNQVVGVLVNGTPVPVTSDTFQVPTTLSASTNVSGTITLQNGGTVTHAFQVIGTGQVTTPTGTYACWKVQDNFDFSADGSTTSTEISKTSFTYYIDPQVGSFIKGSDTVTHFSGTVFTYTAELTSTNVTTS